MSFVFSVVKFFCYLYTVFVQDQRCTTEFAEVTESELKNQICVQNRSPPAFSQPSRASIACRAIFLTRVSVSFVFSVVKFFCYLYTALRTA